MMSSSTEASSSSSRWVYWARPGPILVEVVGERALEPVEGVGRRSTRTVPRWLTSNATAARAARPVLGQRAVRVGSGMSQPPKGTILAPSARWSASRGEVRSVTSANLPQRAGPRGRRTASDQAAGDCRRLPPLPAGRVERTEPEQAQPLPCRLDHGFGHGRQLIGRLEPVLHEQLEVVALVEEPDLDLGVAAPAAAAPCGSSS